MGYRDYSQGETGFDPLTKQFNIMPIIGNGADIQILQHYQKISTTYENFYHFAKMRQQCKGNIILEEIEQQKSIGEGNWSDVEKTIESLTHRSPCDYEALSGSLQQIQNEFSEFLNYAVNSSLLGRLSTDAEQHRWGLNTLQEFLKDIDNKIDLEKIPFGGRKDNHDLYNYFFVNLNFTSLLDDYLFLDQSQFNPHPHRSVTTNFKFINDPYQLVEPRTRKEKYWEYRDSNYLITEVIHPHGYQNIPRSLLFGTGCSGSSAQEAAQNLEKSYWSQANVKYAHLFEDTSLFIIYGSSLGQTDTWWWSHIAQTLLNNEAESQEDKKALLIYTWKPQGEGKDDKQQVLNHFFQVANVEDPDEKKKLEEKICVRSYHSENDHVWLGMGDETAEPEVEESN